MKFLQLHDLAGDAVIIPVERIHITPLLQPSWGGDKITVVAMEGGTKVDALESPKDIYLMLKGEE